MKTYAYLKPLPAAPLPKGGASVLPPQKPMPGLRSQIVSYTKSTVNMVVQNVVNNVPYYVPDNVFNARMAHCVSCELFNAQIKKCSKCGCSTIGKLKRSVETCPYEKDGKKSPKWGPWKP